MSRGTGRVQSEIIDGTKKKNPGFIWNSRTYKWEKDPNYDKIVPGTDDTPNTLYLLTDREKKNVLQEESLEENWFKDKLDSAVDWVDDKLSPEPFSHDPFMKNVKWTPELKMVFRNLNLLRQILQALNKISKEKKDKLWI